MLKFLLISGSPRAGNTEFILNQIFKGLKSENKELILLRNRNIKRCLGCLSCDASNQCSVQDDMQEIYEKMKGTDVFVVGSPNYFDNVSGLLKDFIDRTNPFYKTDLLKGKKLIAIVVGAGKIKNSELVSSQALKYFADCHHLNFVRSFCFQALKNNDIENNPDSLKLIAQIIEKINFTID